jgi:1-pyrroline-5-carboxylate dehydrogenase
MGRNFELDTTSEYALTGAVFSQDRYAIEVATTVKLQNAAVTSISMTNQLVLSWDNNLLVEQELGTNDKAGSPLNLLRWASPRTIKETLLLSRLQIPILGE